MPKASGLSNLSLSNTKETKDGSQPLSPPMSPKSPGSPRSVQSNPGSPRLGDMQAAMFAQATNGIDTLTGPFPYSQDDTASTPATTVPLSPPSPSNASPKHGRDPSKSFFSNLMASKSSHRLHSPDSSITDSIDRKDQKGRGTSRERTQRQLRSKGSTPDLPRLYQPSEGVPQNGDGGLGGGELQAQGDDVHLPGKKGRSKLGGILNRTKSIRLDDSRFMARSPTHLNIDTDASQRPRPGNQYPEAMKTAPIRTDYREKVFADDAGSAVRNRSADRQLKPRQDENSSQSRREKVAMSHSFRDGSGLLSGLQHTGRGMGDRLGRAGKGFLGKITRSGSTTEREFVADDSYVCTVINLPLVKQTRKTRIARRSELSKDKTEFWMPALPWRCIE